MPPDGTGMARDWQAGRGPLAFLPVLLFRDRAPLLSLIVAWALTLGGSIALGAIIAWLVPDGAGPDMGDAPAAVKFFGIVILSPVVETLLMGGVLTLLLRWCAPWQAVVASSVGWGVAHSLLAPLWGAAIWWPFLIFSIVFVTWRTRGFAWGFAAAAAAHVAQNLVPAAGLLLGY